MHFWLVAFQPSISSTLMQCGTNKSALIQCQPVHFAAVILPIQHFNAWRSTCTCTELCVEVAQHKPTVSCFFPVVHPHLYVRPRNICFVGRLQKTDCLLNKCSERGRVVVTSSAPCYTQVSLGSDELVLRHK